MAKPRDTQMKKQQQQKKKKKKTTQKDLCIYLPQGTHSVVVEIQVWVTQSELWSGMGGD